MRSAANAARRFGPQGLAPRTELAPEGPAGGGGRRAPRRAGVGGGPWVPIPRSSPAQPVCDQAANRFSRRAQPIHLTAEIRRELAEASPTGRRQAPSPIAPTYLAGLILAGGLVAWLAAPLMV